ncbi:ABC transporter ATP-binding protein [Neptunomonas concharum]|uniref:ABC transporter ATP-binding protein n=1 Tax=Neptunomonas concharum TaxID=1031538 RepID=A0A5P1R928_9GAMM|nr:ABC transporter ATP-binding protein [Neptunomonas concharum]QEQ96098.1 ABC transporter ATP-binding protein [Neptunomonas concharum]
MDVVRLQNIVFSWGKDAPLIDIPSFSLGKGERVFLQGASGSGKSTLLNLITGLLTPEAGHMYVNDVDVAQLSMLRRDRFRADNIGFVFQSFNLLPYLSLLDNVVLPCRFSTLRKQKAIERDGSVKRSAQRLLSELGLASQLKTNQPVIQLSVGQQQRVAVARALIGSPRLLIADEPTSALDADSRQQFLDLLLREVKTQNSTLLLVSHDPVLGERFDRSVSLSHINSVAVAQGVNNAA